MRLRGSRCGARRQGCDGSAQARMTANASIQKAGHRTRYPLPRDLGFSRRVKGPSTAPFDGLFYIEVFDLDRGRPPTSHSLTRLKRSRGGRLLRGHGRRGNGRVLSEVLPTSFRQEQSARYAHFCRRQDRRYRAAHQETDGNDRRRDNHRPRLRRPRFGREICKRHRVWPCKRASGRKTSKPAAHLRLDPILHD
jgi:hypothetical protein